MINNTDKLAAIMNSTKVYIDSVALRKSINSLVAYIDVAKADMPFDITDKQSTKMFVA